MATTGSERMSLKRLTELEDRLRSGRASLTNHEDLAFVDALHYVGSCIVYAAERHAERLDEMLGQRVRAASRG